MRGEKDRYESGGKDQMPDAHAGTLHDGSSAVQGLGVSVGGEASFARSAAKRSGASAPCWITVPSRSISTRVGVILTENGFSLALPSGSSSTGRPGAF